jgi:hypothetical protein
MSVFVVDEGGNVPLVIFNTQTTPNGQIFYDAPQDSTRQPSQAHGTVRSKSKYKKTKTQKTQKTQGSKRPTPKKGNTKDEKKRQGVF